MSATGIVVTVNVALAAPASTVAVIGTVTLDIPLLNATDMSAAAALDNFTVPVEDAPPATFAGLIVTLVSAGAFTVRAADLVTPFWLAEIAPTVLSVTGTVAIMNVALAAPIGMVTVAGIVAALLSLLSETTVSVTVAPVSFTVPVEDAPPSTLAGVSVTADRAAGRMFIVQVLVTVGEPG